jgi:hypothetical protein
MNISGGGGISGSEKSSQFQVHAGYQQVTVVMEADVHPHVAMYHVTVC